MFIGQLLDLGWFLLVISYFPYISPSLHFHIDTCNFEEKDTIFSFCTHFFFMELGFDYLILELNCWPAVVFSLGKIYSENQNLNAALKLYSSDTVVSCLGEVIVRTRT